MSATNGLPADPGLAVERTQLAWTRIGLTLIGAPSALAAYASRANVPLAAGAAVLALVTGLSLLVASLRRDRVPREARSATSSVLAAGQVLATAATVLLLCASGLLLVLG